MLVNGKRNRNVVIGATKTKTYKGVTRLLGLYANPALELRYRELAFKVRS